MTRTNLSSRPLVSALVVASLIAASCSARPERFLKHPTATDADVAQTRALGIPDMQPIALIEGAPPVEKLGAEGAVSAYKIGGLTLVHKHSTTNAVVAARVYVLGGSTNLSEKTAGLEQISMAVATSGGTVSTPKDVFNGRLDAVGSSVSSFTDRDYSGYAMKSIVPSFDTTWDLFVEAILEPAMPADEVELQREQQLAAIAEIDQDPDSRIGFLASKQLFAGHPYANLQIGTKRTVGAFSANDLAAYQRSMLQPTKMLVVVVGNIPADRIVARVKGG